MQPAATTVWSGDIADLSIKGIFRQISALNLGALLAMCKRGDTSRSENP